jgi:hypothetical protein
VSQFVVTSERSGLGTRGICGLLRKRSTTEVRCILNSLARHRRVTRRQERGSAAKILLAKNRDTRPESRFRAISRQHSLAARRRWTRRGLARKPGRSWDRFDERPVLWAVDHLLERSSCCAGCLMHCWSPVRRSPLRIRRHGLHTARLEAIEDGLPSQPTSPQRDLQGNSIHWRSTSARPEQVHPERRTQMARGAQISHSHIV